MHFGNWVVGLNGTKMPENYFFSTCRQAAFPSDDHLAPFSLARSQEHCCLALGSSYTTQVDRAVNKVPFTKVRLPVSFFFILLSHLIIH